MISLAYDVGFVRLCMKIKMFATIIEYVTIANLDAKDNLPLEQLDAHYFPRNIKSFVFKLNYQFLG